MSNISDLERKQKGRRTKLEARKSWNKALQRLPRTALLRSLDMAYTAFSLRAAKTMSSHVITESPTWVAKYLQDHQVQSLTVVD